MYSLGYINDCIAFTLFVFILFLIIKIDNINKYKIYFILGLLLAIIADGTFSFNSDYHNMEFGYNNVTYFVLIMGVLMALVFIIMLSKMYKFEYINK